MNEELKKMLDSINTLKAEVRNLANEGKIEEAKAKKEELKALNDKFNLIYDLEEEKKEEKKEEIKNKAKKITNKDEVNAFVNAIKAKLTDSSVSASDKQILNQMSGGTPADGGLTVPQDMQTTVKDLRRSQDALENLVHVEPVSTLSGSRVIEVNADQVPFDNVDEAADFPEVATPQFRKVPYEVKKKGGILKVTRELVQDSAENIQAYLNNWISKKAKATRNFMILKQLDTMTSGKEVAMKGLEDLKTILNTNLDPAIALTSSILTNQDGFNWLDTLKDNEGKYILQADVTDKTKTLLFGKYPVIVVSNKVLATANNNIPFYIGDFKEAVTIFDRETLSIEMNTQGDSLWNKDLTGIKVRERLDIQTIDDEAVVKGQVTVAAKTSSK